MLKHKTKADIITRIETSDTATLKRTYRTIVKTAKRVAAETARYGSEYAMLGDQLAAFELNASAILAELYRRRAAGTL